MKLKLLNILNEQLGGGNVLPRGCAKYPSNSVSRKVCDKLNNRTYGSYMYPVIRQIFDSKKQKWVDVFSTEEQQKTMNTLSILKSISPNKKWQWASPTKKINYGTIDDFISGTLPEVGFLYKEVDGQWVWDPLNKLDTNYSDLAVLVTDIVNKSSGFTVEELLADLNAGSTLLLSEIIETISDYPEVLYDKFISDSELYTTQSLFYSLKGEEVEQYVIDEMVNCGWTLIHQGGGGDIIDVFLGIDLIMEKGGMVKTIQCKKVWDIRWMPSTRMNPEGSYRITGNAYVNKQRNLDYVGYATEDRKVIIGGRQKQVVELEKNKFTYVDKMVLPRTEKSTYFYLDNPICTNVPKT